MLTAIIPIDLKIRANDLIKKALIIAEAAERHKVRIVFGHHNRGLTHDEKFKSKLEPYKFSKIHSIPCCSEKINTAKLRNLAFEMVDTEYIILLDVDIFPDFSLFKQYTEKVITQEQPFYILPCLYLTQYGSKLLTTGKVDIAKLKERYYSFSRKEFLHLASPSSITILKADDYKQLNGFNPLFEGHGYEDFDFLLRLCKHHHILDDHPDLLADRSARSPLFAVGFRKYLGKLCLDTLLKKEMAFHLYHDKPKGSEYYAARPGNYRLFADQHRPNVVEQVTTETTLINTFVDLCDQRGINVHEYSILFENKPGYIDRFDTFTRRLRFLFND